MNRGNEKPNHLAGKRDLSALFVLRHFLVLFEHHLSDVVAYRWWHGRLHIICGENDLSPRTVVPNVVRDFRNGADGVLILAPDERLRAAFRRKLKRHFARSVWNRVGIITQANCSALLSREAPALPATSKQTFKDSMT
jgi:hypothetical protein